MRAPDPVKLDRILTEARRAADERAHSYRERALNARGSVAAALERSRANLRELTVHHRDHNHDNPDATKN